MHSSFSFHHLGVACPSIAGARAAYEVMGYQLEGTFTDDIQGVTGEFLTGPAPRIELLQDLPDRSNVAPWISRRLPTVYHYAWLVPEIGAALDLVTERGARPLSEPQPSTYFGGPIVFAMVKGKTLIELIEPGKEFTAR
jgi:methylmalonyl-CoA/ethylmalonyl-CoA epimerase